MNMADTGTFQADGGAVDRHASRTVFDSAHGSHTHKGIPTEKIRTGREHHNTRVSNHEMTLVKDDLKRTENQSFYVA